MADSVTFEIFGNMIKIPDGVPPLYQNALGENCKIVEELFNCETGVGGGGGEAEHEQIQNLLHFLDVYIEVFNNSAKQLLVNKSLTVVAVVKGDSPVIRECITKYREFYRRHFRGVKYLPITKFYEISQQAETEIWRRFKVLTSATASPQVCEERENDLKRLLSLEKVWLEKINGQRRAEDLEIIKAEIVDKLKGEVEATFPYLYLDEEGAGSSCKMMYCEDHMLKWKLRTLLNEAVKQFQEQIPFKDQENPVVITELCSGLEKTLDESVVQELTARNSARKLIIQSYMDSMVENCLEKYADAMKELVIDELASVQLKMEKIGNAHKKFVEEFTPKFVNSENGLEIEIGSADYQVHCLNSYNSKTYESFKKMVPTAIECTKVNLEECERKVKGEVEEFTKKIADILGSYGMTAFTSGFQAHVQNGLGTIFTHVKDANQVASRTLIDTAQPSRILTKDEINLASKLELWKEYYADGLVDGLQESKKFPHSVDTRLLDECHSKSRWLVHENISEECRYSSLGPKIKEEFCQFADNFIANVKTNQQFFIDLVGKCRQHGTPFPFTPVIEGTDRIFMNGVTSLVKTRHQYLTSMPQYQNKSFEELQLEDREKRRAVPLASLRFPDRAPMFSALASNFNFNLKLSKLSSSTKPTNFIFSQSSQPPPSLSIIRPPSTPTIIRPPSLDHHH